MIEAERVASAVDARSCADALVAALGARRRAEADQFVLVATWADFHCPPPADEMTDRDRERQRRADHWQGADGTPLVTQAAATELGMLLEISTYAAQRLLRDVLEVRHRLPRLYDAVVTGRIEEWKARKVARRTHRLTKSQAGWVDDHVHQAVAGLPWGRALDVIEGKVIAADPAAHKARLAEEENRRYVSTGRRSNAAGLRTMITQGAAGDIARLEAMIAHLAELLAAAGDSNALDVRRATALAMLANPALACVFLARCHGSGAAEDIVEDVAEDAAAGATPAADTGVDGSVTASAVELAVAFGQVLKELGTKALDRLRPESVLYLHISEEAVRGLSGTQVARVEDPVAGGPVDIDQLRSWLRSHRVTVKPVIDPTRAEPVDGYEVPTHLREALSLVSPFETFPYGTLSTRQADGDHVVPYTPVDNGGPPGQTALDNLGPLSRRHHLAKTFDGFTVHQTAVGTYYWRTPTGHWYQVDHRGTRALGRLDEPPAAVTAARRLDARPMSLAERHFREQILGDLAA